MREGDCFAYARNDNLLKINLTKYIVGYKIYLARYNNILSRVLYTHAVIIVK